ncbi:amidohydrolase family protein [Ancylobacter dichloromethanicus]|uniref:8-oxoguanine deaminase n=1 Tax=Ancylobacter dichloromethanicus TaxID=518825 RepID=A0A9W6N180_9HYPH|nr:amidohydrolase family protein [Ancylobacter dichloromethanicus]MBS7553087.1 amidohydrolase family protein [Ancylobacter dichloromethanicus]GLK74604.1 8-oxoguanine deaminase [Ancylobacter dichloromethanicus]
MTALSARPQAIRGGLVAFPAEGTVRAADLLIEGGRIAAIVAPGEALPDEAERVDATDRLITPGLVNAHTHSHLAIAKGMARAWTLELHLHNGPWTGGGQNVDDRYLLAQASAAEMLLKGCTACYDLVLELPTPSPEGMFATAAGYADAGMRAVVTPMLADRTFWQAIPGLREALPPEARASVDAIVMASSDMALAACERVLAHWPHDRAQVRPGLAPTIPLHCSDDFWRGARALADRHGAPMHAHLAESKIQALAGQARYRMSLTAHLDRLGILGPDFTAAHGIWLGEDDLALLGRRGACIAHNPSSNFRLGSGIANVPAMIAAGVQVGLGSDACSCSDHQNLFEVMRLACYLSRTASFDPDDWLTPADVFAMATRGSARALGMQDLIGDICPGHAADLVFLDLGSINFTPLNDALYQLVFAEEGRSITRVMVGGRIVVEDSQLTTIDYPALRAQLNDRAREIFAANAPRRRELAAIEPYVKHFCVGLAQGRIELAGNPAT